MPTTIKPPLLWSPEHHAYPALFMFCQEQCHQNKNIFNSK
uniref:Uncharacterized protein n=1 Tax=Rhizophora mucronata TaxID=61149 RepID=A0A2P2Q254_RHIMU